MKRPSRATVVVNYDPAWPGQFRVLRARLGDVLDDLVVTIEHVGSTAVPGLAAKPIIDVDVVIETPAALREVIERLAAIGYRHEGDLGIPGREAFKAPDDCIPHHLYVCDCDNVALREHLILRDYLRAHPQAARDYADVKRRLTTQFAVDRAGYTDAKTIWIRRRLEIAQRPDHPGGGELISQSLDDGKRLHCAHAETAQA